jgi:hypothetical protein
MRAAKFVLFPNTADASPRLIVEALVRSRPVLVNRDIYGGWKYVNSKTGYLFKAPSIKDYDKVDPEPYISSLQKGMQYVMSLDPAVVKSSYYEKYGFLNTSKRLAEIVFQVTGEKYDLVVFKEWRKILKEIGKHEGLL